MGGAATAALQKVYGIEIQDVRIKRADLPEQNEKAVFARMQAERERQAKQYRAEGKVRKKHRKSDRKLKKTERLSSPKPIKNRKSFVAVAMPKRFGSMPMPTAKSQSFSNLRVRWKHTRSPLRTDRHW